MRWTAWRPAEDKKEGKERDSLGPECEWWKPHPPVWQTFNKLRGPEDMRARIYGLNDSKLTKMLFSSELEIVVSFEVKPRPPNRVIVAIARMGSSSLSDQLSNQSQGSSFPLTLNEFLTVLGPKKNLNLFRCVQANQHDCVYQYCKILPSHRVKRSRAGLH